MPQLKNLKHEKFAAEYVRTGNLTKAFVAAGYSKKGAEQNGSKLAQRNEVLTRINELREHVVANVVQLAITERNARIAALQDVWERGKRVIEERAAAPENATVAGGKTGLLVRKLKTVGSGPLAEIVEEFEVDVALMRELRETAKQAAIECGQWIEKGEIAGSVDVAALLIAGRQRAEAVHAEIEERWALPAPGGGE